MKPYIEKLIMRLIIVMLLLSVAFPAFAEIIDVQIKGIDDGVKTTKQQDYKEAVLFAKREAIERSGVQIESITTVKQLTVYEDIIESKAKAILLPGYTIVDIGYTEDGEYTVMLIGKVDASEADRSGADTDDAGSLQDGTVAPAPDPQDSAETDASGSARETSHQPIPSFALLTVRTIPEGAYVQVDGRAISSAPIVKWKLPPGKHQLSVRMRGYHTRTMEIFLYPGDQPKNHFLLNLIARKKMPDKFSRPLPPIKQKPPQKRW